jgi:hypothetical protein
LMIIPKGVAHCRIWKNIISWVIHSYYSLAQKEKQQRRYNGNVRVFQGRLNAGKGRIVTFVNCQLLYYNFAVELNSWRIQSCGKSNNLTQFTPSISCWLM